MEEASIARAYGSAAGALLVIAGIAGFFYNGHFGTGGDAFGNDASVNLLGALAVNGWDNVLHLATGAAALLAVGYAARACALALGALYCAIAVWGFAGGSGGEVVSLLPVNVADDAFHLALGLLGIGAGIAAGSGPSRSPAR